MLNTASLAPGSRQGWLCLFCLCLGIAVHLLLQFQDMPLYAYSLDEWMHIHMATADSVKQVVEYSRYETHPPLGNIIRYFWMKSGRSIEHVRLLSMLFFYLYVVVIYVCGRLYSGNKVGFIAAYLVLFSHAAFNLSFAVRNYTMAEFFTGLAYYYYLLLRSENRFAYSVGYILTAMCSMLVSYSVIYLFFAIFIVQAVFYWKEKDRKRLVQWGMVNAIVGVAFMATILLTTSWASASYLKDSAGLYQYAHMSAFERVLYALIVEIMAVIYSIKPVVTHGYGIDLVLCCIVLTVWYVPGKHKQESYIALLLVFLCAMLNITGFFPFTSYRHLFFLAIPSLLPVAEFSSNLITRIVWLRKPALQPELMICAVLVPLWAFNDPQKGAEYDIGLPEKFGTIAEDTKMRQALADINQEESLFILPKMQVYSLFPPPPSLYKFFPDHEDTNYRLVDISGAHVAFNAVLGRFGDAKKFVEKMQEIAQTTDLYRYRYAVFFETGWGDPVISTLLKCKAIQPQVLYSDAKHMALFRIPMEFILPGAQNTPALERCFVPAAGIAAAQKSR